MAQNEIGDTFNRAVNAEPFALRDVDVEMLFDLFKIERQIIRVNVKILWWVCVFRNLISLDESDYAYENIDNSFDEFVRFFFAI